MNKGGDPECQPQEPAPHAKLRLNIGLGALAALFVIAFAAAVFWRGLSLEDLRLRREALSAYAHAHPLLSVEIYVAAYFLLICFSLPGALIMSLAGGYLFGAVEGAAAAVLALSLGGLVMYSVARWIMGDTLRRRLAAKGGIAARLQAGLEHNAFLALLTLRLIPGLPFGLVNIAAAAVRIPVATYLAATVVGVLPSTVIYVSIGSALVRALNRSGAPKLSAIVTPQVLLPLFGLVALSAAPLAWKAWRARRKPAPQSLAGRDGEA